MRELEDREVPGAKYMSVTGGLFSTSGDLKIRALGTRFEEVVCM